MKSLIISFVLIILTCKHPLYCQHLQPGFSKTEYVELLKISARQVNIPWENITSPMPDQFSLTYRSPEIGLGNQWDLWENDNQVAVIGIRGTTKEVVSWLANFYAVMVPAKGTLQLDKDFIFDYHLASDPKAAVHTGWLIATAFLSHEIVPKIDSLYISGTKNIIIVGHSQGGAIAYLLTSHIRNLIQTGLLPSDLILKTYCSAAPKPGNLYYAYEFEYTTRQGWAYNVVNAADWVPEMPVSIQTIRDYNNINPFVNALPAIRKQMLIQRIILKRAYKKLTQPPKKSEEEYRKFLGDRLFTFIKQQLPGFVKPTYFESSNYVRTGKTIILLPDDEYKSVFPDNHKNIFMHHFFEPYFFLINKVDSFED